MAKIYRPKRPVLDLQVAGKKSSSDESCDTDSEDHGADGKKKSKKQQRQGLIVNKKMPTPSHLFLVAMLDHLCSLYESDAGKSDQLFQAIYRRLTHLKMLNPLSYIDELACIKSQYKRGFFTLMRGALAEIRMDDPSYSLRDKAAILLQPRLSDTYSPAAVDISDILGFHTSRYRDEFIELSTLGKGAYGVVYKAKNKLDSGLYAVKKVIFKDTSPDVWFKLLRETRHLAELTHPHIVRYYGAWLEQEPLLSGTKRLHPNTPLCDASIDDDFGAVPLRALTYQHSEEGDEVRHPPEVDISHNSSYEIVHDKSRDESHDHKHLKADDDSVIFAEHSLPGHSRSGNSGNPYVMRTNGRPSQLKVFRVVMYIQMGLCNETLAEWINKRNTLQRELNELDADPCSRILKHVLKAVDYMHENKVMHRDLKPKNIFISEGKNGIDVETAKVGDFGLSRSFATPPNSPETETKTTRSDVDSQTTTAPPSKLVVTSRRPMTPHPGVVQTPSDENVFQWDDRFTSGVGTTIYAAPEQLSGGVYNEKSDVFSLGLVFFELLQPVGTFMERAHCLNQARRGVLPENFTQHWPVQTKYILQMLTLDPSQRPSVKELLNSELFMLKEQIIEDLKSSLSEERKKNIHLLETVDDKNRVITRLKRELAELRMSLVRTTPPPPYGS